MTRDRKSVERTSPPIFTLRPIRAPRGMTARLPTTVIPVLQPARLLAVGRGQVGPLADDGARADDDLLVEDRPVDDRARPG